jgi:hypothetical protein
MIDTSLFPYQSFPIRLEIPEGKNLKLCFFQCVEHLDKHIERHKLDRKKIKISSKDGSVVSKSNKKTKKTKNDRS